LARMPSRRRGVAGDIKITALHHLLRRNSALHGRMEQRHRRGGHLRRGAGNSGTNMAFLRDCVKGHLCRAGRGGRKESGLGSGRPAPGTAKRRRWASPARSRGIAGAWAAELVGGNDVTAALLLCAAVASAATATRWRIVRRQRYPCVLSHHHRFKFRRQRRVWRSLCYAGR